MDLLFLPFFSVVLFFKSRDTNLLELAKKQQYFSNEHFMLQCARRSKPTKPVQTNES